MLTRTIEDTGTAAAEQIADARGQRGHRQAPTGHDDRTGAAVAIELQRQACEAPGAGDDAIEKGEAKLLNVHASGVLGSGSGSFQPSAFFIDEIRLRP
jgi:hypothetical protein